MMSLKETKCKFMGLQKKKSRTEMNGLSNRDDGQSQNWQT